jgi:hypothetical protein
VRQNFVRNVLTLLLVKGQVRDEAADLEIEDVLSGQDYHSLQGMVNNYTAMVA